MLFDFETYPKIVATVKISNGDIFTQSNITIILDDIAIADYHKMIAEDNSWIHRYSWGGVYNDAYIWAYLKLSNGTTIYNNVYE